MGGAGLGTLRLGLREGSKCPHCGAYVPVHVRNTTLDKYMYLYT